MNIYKKKYYLKNFGLYNVLKKPCSYKGPKYDKKALKLTVFLCGKEGEGWGLMMVLLLDLMILFLILFLFA